MMDKTAKNQRRPPTIKRARQIEGLDANASEEREKMWARAKGGNAAKSAEDKYGYLFGDGTKRRGTAAATRRSGEKDEEIFIQPLKTKERAPRAEMVSGVLCIYCV